MFKEGRKIVTQCLYIVIGNHFPNGLGSLLKALADLLVELVHFALVAEPKMGLLLTSTRHQQFSKFKEMHYNQPLEFT